MRRRGAELDEHVPWDEETPDLEKPLRTRRRPSYVSGRRRTLALAVAVSASVVTPLAVSASGHLTGSGDDIVATAGSAAPTGTTEVPLASAPAAAGVDTDVAGGSAPVKEVSSETPFSMVGVTWKGSHPDASATVRAKNPDGSWGPWYGAESVDDEAGGDTGTGGTEPVFLGTDTTAVQIRLSGVALADTSLADAPAPAEQKRDEPMPADIAATHPTAAPAPAPAPAPAEQKRDVKSDDAPPVPTRFADIRPVAESTALDADTVKAVLLAPDAAPTPAPGGYGDVSAEGGTGVNADIAAKMPPIISRASWGADESIRCGGTTYDDSLAAATVHHTAGSNNYSREQSAGVVRGIYTYHAVNLGWCDVGYNVLVDKYGQAFEGRRGGLTRNVQGAHAGGFNGNTFGISMMGDYSTVAPSDATVQKMGEVIGWRLSIAGVDPKGTDTHYSEGTSYTKYPQGTAVRLPNIFAHRDVGLTTCPGDAGYAKMSRIRDIAAAYAKRGGAPAPRPADPTPPATNPGGTTPRPGTGGTPSIPKVSQGSVQEAVGTALKTVLSGGKLDPQALTKILTGGKSLADIPVNAGSAADALGGDFATLAKQLSGPLGKALTGVQRFGNVSLVKTENGALYSSPETGTHPVWGVIGDAWAAQDFEHGPLGLPVASEAQREDGRIAQRFAHGTIVFDPATGEITVEPNG